MNRKMGLALRMTLLASFLLAACQPQGPSSPEKEGKEPVAATEISPGIIITEIAEMDLEPTMTPEPGEVYESVFIEKSTKNRLDFINGATGYYKGDKFVEVAHGLDSGLTPIGNFKISGDEFVYLEDENRQQFLSRWNENTSKWEVATGIPPITQDTTGNEFFNFGFYVGADGDEPTDQFPADGSATQFKSIFAQEFANGQWVQDWYVEDGQVFKQIKIGGTGAKNASMQEFASGAFVAGNTFMNDLGEDVGAHFGVNPEGGLLIVDKDGKVLARDFDEQKNVWKELPSFSPEVVAMMTNKEAPLTPVVLDFLIAAKEGGFGAEVTAADNKINIPGCEFSFDLKTGETVRSYDYTSMDGTVVPMEAMGMIGENVVMGQDENGNAVIVFDANQCSSDGEWERQVSTFTNVETGEEFTMPEISTDEWRWEFLHSNSTNPEHMKNTLRSGLSAYQDLIGMTGEGSSDDPRMSHFKGMSLPIGGKRMLWGSTMVMVDKKISYKSLYNVAALEGYDAALVGWYDENDEGIVVLVKGEDLNVPRNFDPLFKNVVP